MPVPSEETQGASWSQCGQQPLLLPGSVPALMSFFRHVSQKLFLCPDACRPVLMSWTALGNLRADLLCNVLSSYSSSAVGILKWINSLFIPHGLGLVFC